MVIQDSNEWLHKVRDIEIKYLIKILNNFVNQEKIKDAKILEIGSGDGYVIDKLSKLYPLYDFKGLEVKSSVYEIKSSKVIEYDGLSMDFLKEKYDLIFSFHVLENIEDLIGHTKQISNLLKPNSLWVNIVPSSTWRFLTTLNYYPSVILNFSSLIKKYQKVKIKKNKKNKSSFSKNIFSYIFPQRHGENGNFLTEFYYFSKSFWSKKIMYLCRLNSMTLIHCSEVPYIYCSRDLLRNLLIDKIRYFLSKFIGGSSIVFVVKNQQISF